MLVFKIVGKKTHVKGKLIKTATWPDRSCFINFKILIGILFGLEDFWESRAEIIEIISFLSVYDGKKRFVV